MLSLQRRRIGRRCCRVLLCSKPRVEIILALCDDQESHMGVLQAAELRTFAAIDSRLVRLKGNAIDPGGNQIHFPSKLRDPEAVDDIGGFELNLHGDPHRYMNFVRGRNSLIWIINLPPPLSRDNMDLNSGLPLWNFYSCQGINRVAKNDREHDEGKHNPAQKQPAASYLAAGLWSGGAGCSPAPQERRDEQLDHQRKNGYPKSQHQ